MDIWWPEVSLFEIIGRAVLTYVFLLVIIRLMAKRELGEFSPTDLILLLLIAAAVHSTLNGRDESIVGGLIGATTLLLVNAGVNRWTYRSERRERVVKGKPEVLIFNGEPCHDVLKKHQLSEAQLRVAIRKEGVMRVSDVRAAIFEPDGSISVIKREDEPKPLSTRSALELEL